MRALVTGASGFLGSHLVDRLLADGGCEVRVLVRRSSSMRWLMDKPVEVVHGDVTQSAGELAPVVAGVDLVFHAAGLTKALKRASFFEVNEGGTRNLLEACAARTSPPERFLLVSSAGALGPAQRGGLVVETQSPRPVDKYGRSKLAAERMAQDFFNRMPIAVVRPGGIYGPRDFELLPAFTSVRRGLVVRLGRSIHHVNMAHVADVVRAICLAAKRPEAVGEKLLVGGPNATQGEFAEAIVRALDRRRVLRLSLPAPLIRAAAGLSSLVGLATGKPRIFTLDNANRLLAPSWAFDLSRAERLLGYRPEYDLDRGMAETVAWYRQQGLL